MKTTGENQTQGKKQKNVQPQGTMAEQVKQLADLGMVKPTSAPLAVPTLSSDDDLMAKLADKERTKSIWEGISGFKKMLMTRVQLLAALLQDKKDFLTYKKEFLTKEKELVEAIGKIPIDEAKKEVIYLFMEAVVDAYPQNTEAVNRIVSSGLAVGFFQKADRKPGKGFWLPVTLEDGGWDQVSLNVPNARSVAPTVLKLEKLRDAIQEKQREEAKAHARDFYRGTDSSITALYDSLESKSKGSKEVTFDAYDPETGERGTARVKIEDGVIYPVSGLGDYRTLFDEMTLVNESEGEAVIRVPLECVPASRINLKDWFERTPRQRDLLVALHHIVRLGLKPQRKLVAIRKEATLPVGDLGTKGKPGLVALLAKKVFVSNDDIVHGAGVLLEQNAEGQVKPVKTVDRRDQQHYFLGVKEFTDIEKLPRALGNLVKFVSKLEKEKLAPATAGVSDKTEPEGDTTETDATSDSAPAGK